MAAARLSSSNSSTTAQRVRFISRFGNDSYAAQLRQELVAAGVDVSGCVSSPQLGSGLGLVMLEPDGAASSVVVGGANTAWEQVMMSCGCMCVFVFVQCLAGCMCVCVCSKHTRQI